MGLVFRKVRMARWIWEEGLPGIAEGDIPADPLGDVATTE
jgi:hypothetical protein